MLDLSRRVTWILAGLWTVFLCAPAVAEPAWSERLQRDEIRIEARSVEGSAFEELRGTVEFAGDVDAVVDVFRHVPGHVDWVFAVVESTALDPSERDRGRTYHRYRFSWLAADRDVALDWAIVRDGAGATLTMVAAPGVAPKRNRVVRLEVFRGSFHVVPTSPGRVRVTFRVHLEPGGWLPASVVRRVVIDLPFDTLAGLRRTLVGRAAK